MQPKYQIFANGSDISQKINGRLISLEISDEIGMVSDSLTIELDNRDFALGVPSRGAQLEVLLGYETMCSMGRFVVDEIELKSPPETMIITARASDSMLNNVAEFKAPKTYSWDQTTIGEMIQTIAEQYGLTAAVSQTYQDILVSHLDQTEESDCAFIQRLAEDYSASIKIAGGKLLFLSPLSGEFPDGRPMPVVTLGLEMSGYHYKITERGKYGQVIAKYYDFNNAEEKQITVGVGTPAFTLRDTYTDEKLAKYRAKQKLIEILAGTESMSLEIVGNPAMSAECVVNVFGVAAEAAGTWVVRSARHSLGASGYKTTLELARRQPL